MNGERKCPNCQKPIPNARFIQLGDPVGLSNYCSVKCLFDHEALLYRLINSSWTLDCIGTDSCKATTEEIKK